MSAPHRKRVKHFDIPGHAHELTFSTDGRKPHLGDPAAARAVCDGIRLSCERHRYSVFAFVIMPEHVHVVVVHRRVDVEREPRAASLPTLLASMKRPSAYAINRLLGLRAADDEGTRRFWLPGAGYDRNIIRVRTSALAGDYIHRNPVRRGLCMRPEEWPWSSWKQWNIPGHVPEPWMPVVDRGCIG